MNSILLSVSSETQVLLRGCAAANTCKGLDEGLNMFKHSESYVLRALLGQIEYDQIMSS